MTAYDSEVRLTPVLLAVVPLLSAVFFTFDKVALIGLASLLLAVGMLRLPFRPLVAARLFAEKRLIVCSEQLGSLSAGN